jgi:IPT/TIG domain-containing protein/Big-like domain-containing protein
MLMRLVAVAIGIVLIQGSVIFGALLPEITGLSPNRGPTGGGTVVTLSGSGFTGATSVRFDGIAGTAFAVMSDTEVRVTTPAHAAGVVDVTIIAPSGSNTLPQGFGYGNVPTSAEDTYAVPFNTPLTVPSPGVLENDNSNGAGTMVAAVVTDVTSGSLTLNGDGGFTYTPSTGFSGQLYFFYRATNDDGTGNVARVVLNVSTPTGPQAPSGLRASLVNGNSVTIRFTPSPFGVVADNFEMEAGFAPGTTAGSLLTGSTTPIFTFTAPSGPLYLRVRALGGGLKSPPSNEILILVNVPLAPSPPENVLGLVNGDALALAWQNSYAAGIPSSLVLDVAGSLSTSLPLGLNDTFSFAGVPPGTYTFTLRALNASGSSQPSSPITLTFPGPCSGPPSAPSGFIAYKVGSTIHLLWDLPAGGPAPTAYILNVSGSFVGAFPTPARQMSGTVGAGSYTFSVVASNACGASAATAAQTVTIP